MANSAFVLLTKQTVFQQIQGKEGRVKELRNRKLELRDTCKTCLGWLVVGFEFNCPLVAPGTMGGMPSMRVFLSDPSP